MTLLVRKDCLMAGSLTVQVPVQRPRARGTTYRSMLSLSLFRAPRMHDSTASVDDLRFKALRAFKAAELRSKFKVQSL